MSHIILNSQNYKHNINLIAKKAGDIQKVIIVLKDNAYGHGLIQMAKLSSSFGVRYAAVKTYEEAKAICHLFENVLVLCEVKDEPLPSNISVAISQIEDLKTLPKKSKIELAIDSGMHRNGINSHEIENAISLIKQNSHELFRSYTHFRSADVISSELFWQQQNFKEMKQKIITSCKTNGITPPKFHSANSAATMRLQNIEDDFVRCGIASYGYVGLDASFGKFDLRPVLSLWAKKMSSRVLKKGQKVGYGGIYEAKEDIKISTYDIGYGDGFFRSNGDKKLFAKEKEPIIGKISMDSLSIISDKEEICLFDDVRELAKEFGTITYEITTKLSPFIQRKVL